MKTTTLQQYDRLAVFIFIFENISSVYILTLNRYMLAQCTVDVTVNS